jgi:hypothetical protein
MHGLRTMQNIHIGGTLAADHQGVLPGWDKTGRTLIEVCAIASNDSDARLQIGIAGASPDDDAIMTAKVIGDSNAPAYFTVADFDGVLADVLKSSPPRLPGKVNLTWKVRYRGLGINEVQSVTITGVPTGGTFTLTYSGQTTGAIAYNATAAAVATALKALSNIGDNDVAVTGAAGGPYTVSFMGALAEADIAAMTATASLTGGTTPGVTIATPTAGAAPSGTAAQHVDLFFTFLEGGVDSQVTGLNRLNPGI